MACVYNDGIYSSLEHGIVHVHSIGYFTEILNLTFPSKYIHVYLGHFPHCFYV